MGSVWVEGGEAGPGGVGRAEWRVVYGRGGAKSTTVGDILQSGLRRTSEKRWQVVVALGLSVI